MPKGTFLEVQGRKEQVYIFELLGLPRQLQLSHAREEWGIGKSSLDNYRREAQAQIKKDAEKFKKNALERSLALRNYLMFEALQQGDLRLVFDVQKDTDKLLGQYEAIRIRSESLNINIDSIDFNQFTDNEIKRLASGESLQNILDDKSQNGTANKAYLPQPYDDMGQTD